MIDKQRLLYILKSSISIDTQNPPGKERDLALFLKKYLEGFGIRPRVIEFYPERSNLLFRLRSRNSKRTLVVSPHLDTVPADAHSWKTDPFKPFIKRGKIFGRGATDCKGNLSSGLEALISLKENYVLKNLDIIFCATSDEEAGSHKGMLPLLKAKTIKADFWLILDSDALEIITAQKGLLHVEVEIEGKPSHASIPQRGRNAIYEASRSIVDFYRHRFRYRRHSLLKPPTVNAGTIKGGIKTNVVAPNCSFTLDIRYLPHMPLKMITRDLRRILKGNSQKFRIKILDNQRPIEVSRNNFWIKSLTKVLSERRLPVKLKGLEGATVMSILKDYGFPSFSFGFGAKNRAHTDNEFACLRDLYQGADILSNYFIYLDKHLE